ncbi:reverse transcriptase domain-containing protein [Tanacetum coccineum]|uniref:Reverse transcriptase domain-containing protein n=1 Tax=Tanacetum coccineum TaxID=301880 RepID=A0ABQ4YVS8_9ASTR
MTDKYCPRGEMKKLKAELWNLKVKGTHVLDYNKRFQELALLCVRMFTEESDKIERYNVAQAYIVGTGEKKEYAGTLPLCNMCKLHHNGSCTVKCRNCKKVGHMTQDCRNPTAAKNQRTLTCYECGNQWHYRSDCLELKNQNHGNQAGGTGTHGMVHAIVVGETDQGLDDMEEDIHT